MTAGDSPGFRRIQAIGNDAINSGDQFQWMMGGIFSPDYFPKSVLDSMAKSWVSRSIEALSELVWRSPCALCDRPSQAQGLCTACDRKLVATQLPADRRWLTIAPGLPLLAWGLYDGALKRAIATLKYDGQTKLATALGHGLGRMWLEPSPTSPIAPIVQRLMCESPLVIPIPLHENRQRDRGFNQAELLAVSFCDVTGLTLARSGLRRVRDTQTQFSLKTGDRVANLRDAFTIGSSLLQQRPRSVILVDDIYTSGATVRSALERLQGAGWPVAAVVVAARSASLGPQAPPRPAPKRRDS